MLCPMGNFRILSTSLISQKKRFCYNSDVYCTVLCSIVLKYAFGYSNNGVKMQFWMCDGLFSHQRFQAKTLSCSSFSCDLLFAALAATSFQESQELVNQFSITSSTLVHKKLKLFISHHLHLRATSSKKKTHQHISFHSQPPVMIEGKCLRCVKFFTYLGSKVNSCTSLDDDIVH